MFQPASVSLSGPAFSFLLYETCKSPVRQDGFLLGEIIHKEITSITDHDQKQVDISKIIKINSVLPCPSNNYFVNGRVDKEKIRKYLGSNISKVVAWYKFEPSSDFKFTLKDRALHKQFKELFDIPSDLFSFCFVSMDCTDNFASYNYTQAFIRYSNGNFDKLSIYLPNLSESNQSYKNSEPASAVFTKILSTIKMDVESSKGIVAVTEIENAVQKYINATAEELAEAEEILFNLEKEVNELQMERKKANSVCESNVKNLKMDSSEDLISFEDDIPDRSQEMEKTEFPEIVKRSSRSQSRGKKKIEENENETTDTKQDSDSNKKEELLQNSLQSSPESQRKASTPKARGRARGSRKKS